MAIQEVVNTKNDCAESKDLDSAVKDKTNEAATLPEKKTGVNQADDSQKVEEVIELRRRDRSEDPDLLDLTLQNQMSRKRPRHTVYFENIINNFIFIDECGNPLEQVSLRDIRNAKKTLTERFSTLREAK